MVELVVQRKVLFNIRALALRRITMNQPSQPKGVYVLLFLDMWERFSYWGLQSLLVLYLVKHFLFSDTKSYAFFGAYTALTYVASLLGGIIADRFWGFKKAIILGAVLIIIGNSILAFPERFALYLGLSLIIGGTGLIKPNNVSQLGALYSKNDSRRDRGFTLFHVGSNIGGIMGPIVYGFVSVHYGWQIAFIISSLGVFIGLVIYLAYGFLFKDSSLEGYRMTGGFVSIVYIVVVGVLGLLLLYPEWTGHLLDVVGLFILLGLGVLIYQANSSERQALILIVVMVCFCLFFFALLFQCSTSLILFIERFADRTILGWAVPASAFVSLQPFFVVLLAPLLVRLWSILGSYEQSSLGKMVIGLLFASCSFLFFMLAAQEANRLQRVSLTWIVLGNILFSLGELCIVPPTLATIARLAPVKLRATLTGFFYLTLSFAGYLASLLANLTTPRTLMISKASTAAISYLYAYQTIFYLALILSVMAYLVSHYGGKNYKVLIQNS